MHASRCFCHAHSCYQGVQADKEPCNNTTGGLLLQRMDKALVNSTFTVLYHTISHKLCRLEMKDMHGLQCFSSTDSDGSESFFSSFV